MGRKYEGIYPNSSAVCSVAKTKDEAGDDVAHLMEVTPL
jgi:hypothetical protein